MTKLHRILEAIAVAITLLLISGIDSIVDLILS